MSLSVDVWCVVCFVCQFRALWGSRAELRRFKDGAIVEAVVWTSDVSKRHTIVPSIMTHAATLHMGHRYKTATAWARVPFQLTASVSVMHRRGQSLHSAAVSPVGSTQTVALHGAQA